MTLVVARKSQSTTWLVADTLITGGNLSGSESDRGLKIYFLDPRTLIAYSGSPEIANSLIGNIFAFSKGRQLIEILKNLQECSKGCGVDFIVTQNKKIGTIKKDELSFDLPAAWIGDHTAFSKFQEHFLNAQAAGGPGEAPLPAHMVPLAESELDLYNQTSLCGASSQESLIAGKLRSALELVIGDLSIRGVGGEVVSAVSGSETASYALYLSATSPIYVPVSDGAWHSVGFGDASQGGFGYTIITPPSPGISGWGRYYFQSRIGIYYSAALDTGQFVRFTGTHPDAATFCDALLGELGYRPLHCGSLQISD